jgi:hypothetical protein
MLDPKEQTNEYLRRASEHEKRATNALDPKLKAMFRTFAEEYRQLAAQSEQQDQQLTSQVERMYKQYTGYQS